MFIWQSGGGDGFAVLRVIRLTKAFRILRIGKYSKGLQLLLQVTACVFLLCSLSRSAYTFQHNWQFMMTYEFHAYVYDLPYRR